MPVAEDWRIRAPDQLAMAFQRIGRLCAGSAADSRLFCNRPGASVAAKSLDTGRMPQNGRRYGR
jgi:hypothetical protein